MPEDYSGNWNYGVALRDEHFESFKKNENHFNCIEVVSENYLYTEGEKKELLIELSKHCFTHLHGVSANIGSFDDFDKEWLKRLKALSIQTNASLLSDHLCFTRLNGKSSFELIPVPMTDNMVDHIGKRITFLKKYLEKDFLVENISRYFTYKGDQMNETEFINKLHDKYGVRIILDINNVYVSAQNLNFSSDDYLNELTKSAVGAYHVGGFEIVDDFHFDTHGAPVHINVEALFHKAIKRFGMQPCFLERDNNIPKELSTLEKELISLLEPFR